MFTSRYRSGSHGPHKIMYVSVYACRLRDQSLSHQSESSHVTDTTGTSSISPPPVTRDLHDGLVSQVKHLLHDKAALQLDNCRLQRQVEGLQQLLQHAVDRHHDLLDELEVMYTALGFAQPWNSDASAGAMGHSHGGTDLNEFPEAIDAEDGQGLMDSGAQDGVVITQVVSVNACDTQQLVDQSQDSPTQHCTSWGKHGPIQHASSKEQHSRSASKGSLLATPNKVATLHASVVATPSKPWYDELAEVDQFYTTQLAVFGPCPPSPFAEHAALHDAINAQRQATLPGHARRSLQFQKCASCGRPFDDTDLNQHSPHLSKQMSDSSTPDLAITCDVDEGSTPDLTVSSNKTTVCGTQETQGRVVDSGHQFNTVGEAQLQLPAIICAQKLSHCDASLPCPNVDKDHDDDSTASSGQTPTGSCVESLGDLFANRGAVTVSPSGSCAAKDGHDTEAPEAGEDDSIPAGTAQGSDDGVQTAESGKDGGASRVVDAATV